MRILDPPRFSLPAIVVCAVVAFALVALALVAFGARASTTSTAQPTPSRTSVQASLDEAVGRTLATGSARVDARLTRASGPAVAIRGVTSFSGPASELTAAVESSPGDTATVRVTDDGRTWLRRPGTDSWTAIDASVVGAAAEAMGWSDLLRRLEGAGRPLRSGALAASLAGEPATVWLDRSGRIERVRVEKGAPASSILDLRFLDLGTPVVVVAP